MAIPPSVNVNLAGTEGRPIVRILDSSITGNPFAVVDFHKSCSVILPEQGIAAADYMRALAAVLNEAALALEKRADDRAEVQ